MPQPTWRKSSRSTSGSNCVEVATNLIGVVGVRDSKDPHGPTLSVSRSMWTTFIANVKAATFPSTDPCATQRTAARQAAVRIPPKDRE